MKEGVKNKIEQYLKSLDLEFSFIGESDTNGTSIYYRAGLKDGKFDDMKKVRFSDHSVFNVDRMRDEIHISLKHAESLFSDATNKLMYKLGAPGYSYEAVRFEKKSIEVKELHPGATPISSRVTKKGATLYTIEITKPSEWGYIKN
jgi:hypothetical protein